MDRSRTRITIIGLSGWSMKTMDMPLSEFNWEYVHHLLIQDMDILIDG